MPTFTRTDFTTFELAAGLAITAAAITVFAWWTARDDRSVVEMAMGLLFVAIAMPALWFLVAVPFVNSKLYP